MLAFDVSGPVEDDAERLLVGEQLPRDREETLAVGRDVNIHSRALPVRSAPGDPGQS